MARHNAQNWAKIESILDEAYEMEPELRMEYVISQCGTDQELLKTVVAMIEAMGKEEETVNLETPIKLLSYRVMEEESDSQNAHATENERNWNTNAYAYRLIGLQLGPYMLTELLGKGGMGIVYEAIHVENEEVVAIKILYPWLGDDPQFVHRFKREAKTMLELQHPHIIEVFAVEKQEEYLYIVMERVNGGTLYDMVRRNIRLKEQAIIELITQILSALAEAHQANIIHRDIKPQNILLTKEGQVKVGDFGLAKFVDVSRETSQHTASGATAGTSYYMSPEQLKGLKYVDQRGDLYAVGMTMYQLLVGRVPFEPEESIFTIYKKIEAGSFPSITQYAPDLPHPLVSIVTKALYVDPGKRYQSAQEMLGALQHYKETGESEISISPTQQPRRVWIYATSVVALLICMSAAYFFTSRPSEQNTLLSPTDADSLLSTQALANIPRSDTLMEEADLDNRPIAVETPPFVNEPLPLVPAGSPLENPAPAFEDNAETFYQLDIRSTPGGAYVIQNNDTIGTTPKRIDSLKEQSTQFVIAKEGFVPHSIEWTPADSAQWDIQLEQSEAILHVLIRPYGSLYIGGIKVEDQTNALITRQLKADTHTLRVFHPDFGYWDNIVTLSPDDTLTSIFNYEATVPDTVVVISSPQNAEIVVDGIPSGRYTPSEVPMYPGRHIVTVRKDGYMLDGFPVQINSSAQAGTPLKLTLTKL